MDGLFPQFPILASIFMSFSEFLNRIFNLLYLFAGILAAIYLIVAGIQYITSGGDATKAMAARTAIINAIIGIILVILAFSITQWIKNLIILGKP